MDTSSSIPYQRSPENDGRLTTDDFRETARRYGLSEQAGSMAFGAVFHETSKYSDDTTSYGVICDSETAHSIGDRYVTVSALSNVYNRATEGRYTPRLGPMGKQVIAAVFADYGGLVDPSHIE